MAKTKPAAPASVEAFLAAQDPAVRPLLEAVRSALLGADPGISEGVKWNVPSFKTTEYFATVNARVKEGVGLILHFGAKKNALSETGVKIADPQALLHWLAKDRAAVAFRDAAQLEQERGAFVSLIREWIRHL